MTTENLKAVLTESDFIERLEAMENDLLAKANGDLGDAMYYFAQVTNAAKNEISRLAAEVVRLREGPITVFTEPEETVRLKDAIRELEAKVAHLKKLDDDNNADSMRRLQQMERDKRTIKELQAKLKAWESAEVLEIRAGTYHLKPREADDAQGN